MKSPTSLVLLLSACSAFAAFPISSVPRKSNLPTVANKFIVEVNDVANIPTAKRSLASPHELLYAHLKTRDVSFHVTKEFKAEGLFVGAAITLENPQDAISLQDAPGVTAIRPVRMFDSPKPVFKHVVTGPDDPAIPPDSESTHILTGVDKLHAQGILGSGIKIGIIDTGIDYTHPFLGGAIGPGNKIIGGFDFVGDNYTGLNTPMPDDDPLDQCNGHGTHVAGIIGCNPGNPFNISGVAYEASITSYRVFGCTGSVTDDVLVDALLTGFKDGQDILTMSLGGADGWTESSSAVVSSRLAGLGKVITIAAGNDGASGSWYTSSPGNAINAISVASLDNTVIPLQNATVNGAQHDPITYFDTFPLPVTSELPIFATSNSTTVVDDACNPLPDTTPDLSDKLVIIRRGTCTFAQKVANAAAKGAQVALIYDNGSGFAAIDVGANFTAALIQAADGEFLVQEFVAGAPVTISFPQSGGSTNFPDPSGGLISSFTSYGPSNDFFFKPAVAAPGGNILSTLPVPLGSFGVESGTSMATPFTAASAALILSVKGKSADVAKGVRSLLESTGQRVASSHTDGDPLQTVTQQGAGLVNVFNAVHAETLVSPTELIVNDTAHAVPVQKFTIKNTGSTSKKYTLSHVPAGTALTVQAGTIFPADGPVPLTDAPASVSVSPSSFSLRPGASQTVTATIAGPHGLDASTFPVYSGFIEITDGSQNFHVTYLGLVGSLIDKQVVDDTDIFFGVPIPTILDSQGNVQAGPVNYTFVGLDLPTLLWRQAFGTPRVVVDLVDPNIQVNTSLNTRADGSNKIVFTFPQPHKAGTFSQVPTLGSILEIDFLSRNNEDPTGNGFNTFDVVTPTFANGTTIPNGLYRLLFRALKITGDATNEDDYEVYLSPIIGVNA
ncbi:subtilisin-like protease [Macrolepiota fuliginosa MF-IS2]|uniref:Subtilisin-like protease n=1 Tax=Macrolepiota fuliginosa MF-IS2 TaxID=1400762 RepID=A0A9P5XB24_9AGAR|nr:subtilisin-like protease [Macrolepiota fuliginosa MF-IS2]